MQGPGFQSSTREKKFWPHSVVLEYDRKLEEEGGHSSVKIVRQCVESHCNKYELGEVEEGAWLVWESNTVPVFAIIFIFQLLF